MRRGALLLLLTFLGLLLGAVPAAAHSGLQGSNPAPGTVLEESPDEIVLTFSENPKLLSDTLRVLGADGENVAGRAELDGEEVRADLDEALEGSYLVVWKVVSQDSHVVSGSFAFSVGAEGPLAAAPDQGGDTSTAPGRIVTYAGITLLLGAVLGHLLVPGEARGKRVRRLHLAGVLLTLLGTGIVFWTQMQLLGDGALEAIFAGSIGVALTARVVLALLLWAAVYTPTGRNLLPILGTLLALTGGMDTHAQGDGPNGILVAGLHTLGAGVWLGGIILVLLHPEVGRRFTPIALSAVGLIVLTGVLQGAGDVPKWSLDSPYVQVLVGKLLLFALMVMGGWYSMRRIRRFLGARRSVLFEAATGAAILVLTGLLTSLPPPADRTIDKVLEEGGVQLQVELDRQSGKLELVAECTEASCTGEDGTPRDVRARVRYEEDGTGVALTREEDVYEGYALAPEGGSLEVVVQVDEFTVETFIVEL